MTKLEIQLTILIVVWFVGMVLTLLDSIQIISIRKILRMNSNNENEIKKSLRYAKILLLIGAPITFLTPIIFTQEAWFFDFTNSGQVGDTIGGITAPFMNLLGAILVILL